MQDGILRDFTNCVMFDVCIVVNLLEVDFFSLVLSHLVVGFEKLILNPYLLYAKVRIDIDVLYL